MSALLECSSIAWRSNHLIGEEWRRRYQVNARDLYLDLLKRVLTDDLYDPVESGIRDEGRDWPSKGCTMIGRKRLDNLQYCIESVLANRVAGDLIETGVWRGG